MFALRTLGIGCYFLALLIVLLFSVAYLRRTSFMPYHQQAVCRPWHDIDPMMQKLLLALIHALGFAWFSWLLCCVFLLILLLSTPFEPGVWLIFQAVVLLSLVAPAIVAYGLKRHTGARTPVAGGLAAALLSSLGLVLLLVS